MKKGLEISIPKSLDDITLEQYLKYIGSITGEATLSEESHTELVLSIFCNVQLKHLILLESKQVEDILSRVLPIIQQLSNNNIELIRRFTIDGVEYGIIPNLDNISYGENKDICNYLLDRNTIPNAMGVLYRPIVNKHKETYLIEEYDASGKYTDIMKQMPINVFLSSQVFFYNLTKDLLKHIPKYLEKEMGEVAYKELMQRVSINQIGEDTMKFSALHKEILQDLTK